jgi:hypothetical protein
MQFKLFLVEGLARDMLTTSRHVQSVTVSVIFHEAVLNNSVLEVLVTELFRFFLEWRKLARDEVGSLTLFSFGHIGTGEMPSRDDLVDMVLIFREEF